MLLVFDALSVALLNRGEVLAFISNALYLGSLEFKLHLILAVCLGASFRVLVVLKGPLRRHIKATTVVMRGRIVETLPAMVTHSQLVVVLTRVRFVAHIVAVMNDWIIDIVCDLLTHRCG